MTDLLMQQPTKQRTDMRVPHFPSIGSEDPHLPPLGVKNVKIQENSEKIRGPPGDP